MSKHQGSKQTIVNSADEAIIAHRRELVARARLRGATQREIVEGLKQIGFVNPRTGEPWCLATVHKDLKAIQSDWRKEARQAIDKHKARQLAELQEARRQAWHDNDMASVLRAIGQEMALLGTETPKKQDNLNVNVDLSTLPDELIDMMARGEKIDLATIASQSRAGKTETA